MPIIKEDITILRGQMARRFLIEVNHLEHNKLAKTRKVFRELSVGFGYEVRDSMRAAKGLQAYNSAGDLVGEFNPRRDVAWVEDINPIVG